MPGCSGLMDTVSGFAFQDSTKEARAMMLYFELMISRRSHLSKTCFVIMPFRAEFSSVYQAIRQAVEDAGLQCVRGDERPEPIVVDGIEKGIADATVCAADLTGLNHNVVFEVAMAISQRKRLVLITQDSPELLPFDLRHMRVHQYTNDSRGLDLLRGLLRDSFVAELENRESPVRLLQQMILPTSLEPERLHVVAASPLSWRQARRQAGGFEKLRRTSSDHVGIRGLIHAFGLISGLQELPDLVDPGDYKTDVALTPGNLYCLGSPKANRWTGLVLKAFCKARTPCFSFRPAPDSEDLRDVRVDLHIGANKWLPSGWNDSWHRYKKDFGLIVRGPHPNDPGALMMILAGRGATGTEAACRAVTEDQPLAEIQDWFRLHHLDLDDHRQAFWAVVEMERNGDTGETRPGTLKVLQVDRFQ
jgi:hypothetical protein